MTPEELREAAAQAIAPPGRWPFMDEEDRAYYRARAGDALRVVREALREPSDGMWEAGRSQLLAGEGVLKIWRAMLAASPLGGPGHE